MVRRISQRKFIMNNSEDSQKTQGRKDPKWASAINDSLVWSPQQVVSETVLRQQAGIADDELLVRDHNSPNDTVIAKAAMIDLSQGNVFYTLHKNELGERSECQEPAKLAYVVNDRHEVVTRSKQTGETLRALFGLQANVSLIRDYESPNDLEIGLKDSANFADGPVFVTRKVEHMLVITVNSRQFSEADGVKKEMSGLEIAKLVYPEKPDDTSVRQESAVAREVPLGTRIEIKNKDSFVVTRKNVTGGFAIDRVDREVAALTKSGQRITVIETPMRAVIYHGLKVKPGGPVAATDVLVAIPASYPGQMIDGVYLPVGSPLIGRTKGADQGQQFEADGKRWTLISYHPHNGGGGPQWNPNAHGFHTYISEVLSWLNDLQ